MGKFTLTLLFICCISSCSQYEHCEDDIFREAMDDFYSCHMRYPAGASDYTYMFYKSDSVNNFEYLRARTDEKLEQTISYERYYQVLDSLYPEVVTYDFSLVFQHFIHEDADYIKITYDKDSIMMKDDKKKIIFTSRNIEELLHEIDSEEEWKQLDTNERLVILKFQQAKLFNSDSIILLLPDSVFNSGKSSVDIYHKGLFLVVGPLAKENKEFRKTQYFRYSKKNGITDIKNRKINVAPDERSLKLIQCLDSIINIDKRINFIQFNI